MIAVTGATGGIGGGVARRLAEAGVAQRLVVRDPSRAPQLDGAEVAVATYADGDALRAAFAGADSMLFVSGHEDADRVSLHRGVVEAAVDAGVRRVVYTSFQGAAPDCTFTFGRDHFHTENVISDAGLDFTFLRDSIYADFLAFFPGADGVIRAPAGDGRVAAVARADVARVAATVLLDGSGAHDGARYDLTGPEALTVAEAAEILSAHAPIPITYEAETLEEAYASRASYGAPDWEVAGWVTSYAAIATGELEAVSDAVERVTGTPATGLDALLTADPPAWSQLTAEP